MATYPGDLQVRPDYAVCAISATGLVKRKREALIGKMAICWFTGNSHDIGTHHVVNALNEQLRISRHEVHVITRFPRQYLVFFSDSRAYRRVLHHRSIHNRGRVFKFEPWTERRNVMETKLEFRHCAIHNIEEHARRQERTRTYDLWAWSSNPSKIPKKVLLTITDPDREQPAVDIPLPLAELQHDPPEDFKGAYDYKLHIHLDVVKDLSFLQGRGGSEGPHNRKPRREFLRNYRVSNFLGERCSGQNHDNITNRDYCPHRDKDDHDDYHRGTRRHHSVLSWGRATHCHGAVEDCYSSTRYRVSNQGHSGHRNGPLNSNWGTGERPSIVRESSLQTLWCRSW
ncbi:unnamed protein product [Urochloa humidicola]